MRSVLPLLSAVALALVTVACGPSIEVRTLAAPELAFSTLHTFHMLPAPARRDGRPVTGSDDPMIDNSIANRALRERVVKSLQERGYVLDEKNPDFAVALYAAAHDKVDVTVWDYGYPVSPVWRGRYPRTTQTVTQYTEGSVVIDLVNPHTQALIWRGEGTATLSDDLGDNIRQLADVAEKIVSKLPQATSRAVAARR